MYRLGWVSLLTMLLGMGVFAAGRQAQAGELSRLQGQRDRLAQTTLSSTSSTCPPPVLSRLVRHKVATGETLESIAQRYNLIPATLLGMNPALRSGKAVVGTEILVPPYNGIRYELKPKQTLRDVAVLYKVRPDALFEVNGCQEAPKVVFVPGVNWSPVAAPGKPTDSQPTQLLAGYPLTAKSSKSSILLGYGWGIQPLTNKVGFHGGVDLAAAIGSSVLAVGNGTVAFAGKQGPFGNMVVINHPEGLQTRYAQLASIKVKVGQTVKRGQLIGTVGTTGTPSSKSPHLHFEVRVRSNLGWVAENPESYLWRESPRSNQAKK